MYQLVDGDDLIGEDIALAGSAFFSSADHALCNIAHVNEVICAEGERYGELALEEHSDHLADGRDLEVIGAAASAGIADNCLKLVVVILKHIVCGGSLSLCIGAVKNLGIEVRNLTHNLIIGERGISVNGGSVDKAFYAALFARLNDVLCAVDIAKYVLALDQGTTSSRAIVFDKKGNIVAKAQKEFDQIYPAAGWVEHDPMEILFSQFQAVTSVFASGGIKPEDIAAIGITNQRETTIMWDRETGKPVYNAIVWQCRRTAELCEQIKADGMEEYIKDKTGLVIDAYFSGTKIKWILDNVPGARALAEADQLLFGTVETWLIWNLTGGRVHITDYSNASRTMLFDVDNLCWDEKMCEYLNIPMSILPEVKPSSMVYGRSLAA